MIKVSGLSIIKSLLRSIGRSVSHMHFLKPPGSGRSPLRTILLVLTCFLIVMVVSLVMNHCEASAVEPEGGKGVPLTVFHYYPSNPSCVVIEGTSTHSASFKAQVEPNTEYTFTFFSPAGSNQPGSFFSRFRVASFNRAPYEGLSGSYIARSVNDLSVNGNYYSYTFTTPSDCNYILIFMVSGVSDNNELTNLMASLQPALYRPLSFNSNFSYSLLNFPARIVSFDFDLSCYYGYGTYNYNIYYKPYDADDSEYRLIVESLESGPFSCNLENVDPHFNIKIVCFTSFESSERIAEIDLGLSGGGTTSFSPLFSDVSFPEGFDSVAPPSLDPNFYQIIDASSRSLPSEIYILMIPLLVALFIGWWLHK